MAAYNFGYSRYSPDQTSTDPTQYSRIGGQIGKDIGSLAGAMSGSIESAQMQDKAEKDRAKVQSLMAMYNNPNDSAFLGLSPSQRALKLSRLLLPYDKDMAGRYEALAKDIESREDTQEFGREKMSIESEEKAKALAQSEKMKEAELRSLEERKRMELEAKGEKESPINPNDIYAQALGSFTAGKYPQWYIGLSPAVQNILPDPENVSAESIQALAKKSIAEGRTLEADVSSAKSKSTIDKAAAGNASLEIGQQKIGDNGYFVGIPTRYNDSVNAVRNNLRKDLAAPGAVINEGRGLLDLLGDGSKPVTGQRAIAIITKFNKTLDPGAVVRDSDFKVVEGAGGLQSQIKGFMNKVSSGTTIQPEEIRDMRQIVNLAISRATNNVFLANRMAKNAITQIDKRLDPSLATSYGLPMAMEEF